MVSGPEDTEVTHNAVTGNRVGINIGNNPGTILSDNRFCSNVNYDITAILGLTTGQNNTCDVAIGYDDHGATGCAFSCAVSPNWNYDYNGNGLSDVAIFRQSSGLWAVRGLTRVYFGGGNDRPVPGDYVGDGTTDIAIFRPSSGLWAVQGATRVYFGTTGDLPVVR